MRNEMESVSGGSEEIGSESKSGGGAKALLIVLIIIVLAVILVGGWYFFIKKSAEGGACTSDTKCEAGLTCANKICSSGVKGSSCSAKTDCKMDYCVNSKCTEGKVSDACVTYKDCNTGLYCKTGACATPPDYTKYFSSIIISKIKPGSGPGPDNPETATKTFKMTDAIEMDFVGVKATTIGAYYYEIVNSTTGEVSRSSKNEQELKFAGRDIGTGTSLDNVVPGTYDLNIYFKDELVYTTQITISE